MSDTGNMWANMLGLGPLFATINDPAFQSHIRQIVESITETAERCRRIEMKLDLLLDGAGHDRPDFVGLVLPYEPVRATNISTGVGADGATGGRGAAGVAADDGVSDGAAGIEGDAGGYGPGAGPHRVVGGAR